MSRHALTVAALTILTGISLPNDAAAQSFCNQTAQLLFTSCNNEAEANFRRDSAACLNITVQARRTACDREVRALRSDSRGLCRDQLSWRRRACRVVGQDRFDPVLDPAAFETNFTNLQNENRFFPLTMGNISQFEGGGEVHTVEVRRETNLIEGVTCVVVGRTIRRDGTLVANIDDSFAQGRDGTVFHCSQDVNRFQTFPGDQPQRPRLIGTNDSFRGGTNRDRPGVFFPGSPAADDAFLTEFAPGRVENMTEILATDFPSDTNRELRRFVPQRLMNLLCDADCVVTRNISMLEPGRVTHRFFAPGIGLFLEVDPDTGDILQLTDCNFDARCGDLPRPVR